jgi:hypothetical protein
MKAGAVTPVSAGTLQGAYRPQLRVYYHNAKYGILFQTLEKRIRCKSRKRAIQLAKEWMSSAEGATEIANAQAKIAENPENLLT